MLGRVNDRPEAMAELADIAAYSPAAAYRAVEEIDAMAARGFNHGIETTPYEGRRRWYWPASPLAVYYVDDGRTLTVTGILDERRLRRLPERA